MVHAYGAWCMDVARVGRARTWALDLVVRSTFYGAAQQDTVRDTSQVTLSVQLRILSPALWIPKRPHDSCKQATPTATFLPPFCSRCVLAHTSKSSHLDHKRTERRCPPATSSPSCSLAVAPPATNGCSPGGASDDAISRDGASDDASQRPRSSGAAKVAEASVKRAWML